MLFGSKFDMELNPAIWILQRFPLEVGGVGRLGEKKNYLPYPS